MSIVFKMAFSIGAYLLDVIELIDAHKKMDDVMVIFNMLVLTNRRVEDPTQVDLRTAILGTYGFF